MPSHQENFLQLYIAIRSWYCYALSGWTF